MTVLADAAAESVRALPETAARLNRPAEQVALQAVMDTVGHAADERRDAVQPSLAEARMWQDFMLERFDDAEAGDPKEGVRIIRPVMSGRRAPGATGRGCRNGCGFMRAGDHRG